VDAERARYLKLQAELGGSEVILPAPLSAAEPERPAPPSASGAPSPIDPSIDQSAQPRWRKDAPPIPAPGLVITTLDGSALGHAGASWVDLAAVAGAVHHCAKCLLCQERKNTVPGEGDSAARLMLVGEGPGATEDETGRAGADEMGAGRTGAEVTGDGAAVAASDDRQTAGPRGGPRRDGV